ncbi:hypothetical protein MesoLjLa_21420 [Mesorhizobium sp. L-2-11]|nr:hypothetical protein MesoLjLa_21420 [Mesorhizobium sp. L-2-11]
MRQVDADPQVRIAVLTGEGRAFYAGMDVTKLEALAEASAAPVSDVAVSSGMARRRFSAAPSVRLLMTSA